jgi:hypothetical protein
MNEDMGKTEMKDKRGKEDELRKKTVGDRKHF